MKMNEVVVITGCSSGICGDLAKRLTQAGYTDIATAKKLDSQIQLDATLKLTLDVSEPASICEAVKAVHQRFRQIDKLIHKPGNTQIGAVEELADEQAWYMYDVNVFGTLRRIRAVVPFTGNKDPAGSSTSARLPASW